MLNDRIDRFLFGLFDETTGIDNDDLGLLRITGQFESVLNEGAQHDFGIDLVLGTTQIHKANGSRAGGMPARSFSTELNKRRGHTAPVYGSVKKPVN